MTREYSPTRKYIITEGNWEHQEKRKNNEINKNKRKYSRQSSWVFKICLIVEGKLLTPHTFIMNSIARVTAFVVVLSSVWGSSLFGLAIFMKCYLSLSFGDEEAVQQHTWCLCMNWIMDARWPITDRLWKKWSNQPLIILGI